MMRLSILQLSFLLVLLILPRCGNGGRIPAIAMVVARTKLNKKLSKTPATTAKSLSSSSSPSKTLKQKTKARSKQANDPQPSQQQTITSSYKQNTAAATSWRTAGTVGEAVQLATSTNDLLEIASTMLWLPTDPNLPIHFKQPIHHDRRQRWSAQLLCKLGDLMPSRDQVGGDDPTIMPWQNEHLARAVLAAAYPFITPDDNMIEPDKIPDDSILANFDADGSNGGKSVRVALVGLATLAGKVPILSTGNNDTPSIHPDIIQGIQILIKRAEAMAYGPFASPLNEICEMRWASRGVLMRLGPQLYDTLLCQDHIDEATDQRSIESNELLSKLLPRMQERVKHLPFDILPMGVPEWVNSIHHREIMDRLQQEIPFLFDTITTRTGAIVTERRGTAWVTEPGVGALAYSGKLMPPTSPLPPVVQSTMRLVEAAAGMPRNYFDCALCNHYPTGDAACQFHTDPEHGTMWERASCVVAMGDPRRFAFRPIPLLTTWQAWDGRHSSPDATSHGGKASQPDECTPAVILLFAGDIVQLWGTCNDDFHHAVYPGDAANHNDKGGGDGGECLGRISLVLKRAMVHKGNRRGHGLAGEGRRSRR